MLDRDLQPKRFSQSISSWVRSFALEDLKVLIVCRGPVRKEAADVFDAIGVREFGMLLSEKDSIVYPRCLAPELRTFKFPYNIHRVSDYAGAGKEEKAARIQEIVDIARRHAYTHVFAGYGFMAEDSEFIGAIEAAGLGFIGPGSHVARQAGSKDEAKKLARKLQASVTPGLDNISALALLRKVHDQAGLERIAADRGLSFRWDGNASMGDNAEKLLQIGYDARQELVSIEELQREAQERVEEIWKEFPGRRIRFKHVGGGGGKGQRVISRHDQIAPSVLEILAESKVLAAGSNRNFLIELNIETTRHNEIQLMGNGDWCVSLGGRDCSVQMHEQKLLEVSLTQELLRAEIEACADSNPRRAQVLQGDLHTLVAMEAEAERFGEAVALDSVSTFESIVEGTNHFFMEVNTRIQVEHRVTEMVYMLEFIDPADPLDRFYVDSLIEAMVLLALHGRRLPRPRRVPRHLSGAEVRINATNQALQPHAGGLIHSWSPPLPEELRDDQGIGTPNPDTGQFVFYKIAGAYDSNIALVVTQGSSRKDNLERLSGILRRTEMRGWDLQTNYPMHYGLVSFILGRDPMLKPSTSFMLPYLSAVGALAEVIKDIDLEFAWTSEIARLPDEEAKGVLRRKETLIMRPIERLFSNPHLLAGFLSLHHGKLWDLSADGCTFADNPFVFLQELYHYLHLEWRPGAPPARMIWEHDQEILRDGADFYARIRELTGTQKDCRSIKELFASKTNPLQEHDAAFWDRCLMSHEGFQLGMELLLMIPRAGKAAGFFDIKVNDALEIEFPKQFLDAAERPRFLRALNPPPKASSDEIVTPMGGHFFSREAPHLPPLIEEGAHFEPGQPLFVIEVMKMFNKVTASFGGTIVHHLLSGNDGKIVAKGQTIFKIRPDEMHKDETEEEIRKRRKAATLVLLE